MIVCFYEFLYIENVFVNKCDCCANLDLFLTGG